MTAEPFDYEDHWRAVDRNVEFWTWTCADCGETCVGEPEAHWCGAGR